MLRWKQRNKQKKTFTARKRKLRAKLLASPICQDGYGIACIVRVLLVMPGTPAQAHQHTQQPYVQV